MSPFGQQEDMSFPTLRRKESSSGDSRWVLGRKHKKPKRPAGCPLLHCAAGDNLLESCTALLEKGDNVNLQDVRTGATAIHVAVEEVRKLVLFPSFQSLIVLITGAHRNRPSSVKVPS